MSQTTTSFEKDIKYMFAQYRDRMTWRLDLQAYQDVKSNAELIYGLISTGQMPPANQGTLSPESIAVFKQWMDEGCPA